MHSTKNQIITELFQSKEFNECISRMDPEHLREDLKSEVMLILCEKSASEIVDLQASGGLKYYTVRIILNLIQSNTSPFYKKYRQIHIPFDILRKEGQSDEGFDRINEYEWIDSKVSQIEKARSSEVTNKDEISTRELRELQEDNIMARIDELYWYDKEVLLLYLKHGNYRAIEKETGIPWESTYSTIQKVIKKLRKHVECTTS